MAREKNPNTIRMICFMSAIQHRCSYIVTNSLFQVQRLDFRLCANYQPTLDDAMDTTLAGTLTARRGCAKSSSMADATATKTTLIRSRNAKKRAGVHRNAIATASSVSDMTNTVVNYAAA